MASSESKNDEEMQKRLALAQERWDHSGRVASILGAGIMGHLTLAREYILQRKQLEAALEMQRFFRGCYTRRWYMRQFKQFFTTIVFLKFPHNEILESVTQRELLICAAYSRQEASVQNKLEVPSSVVGYIAIFTFYEPNYLVSKYRLKRDHDQ